MVLYLISNMLKLKKKLTNCQMSFSIVERNQSVDYNYVLLHIDKIVIFIVCSRKILD